MTIDDFWKKYNHCPLCIQYSIQNGACDGCRWELPIYVHMEDKFDKFFPTDECISLMNKEICG